MNLDATTASMYQNTTEYYLDPDPTPIVSENELKIAVAEKVFNCFILTLNEIIITIILFNLINIYFKIGFRT